jgi:hypothetical protein
VGQSAVAAGGLAGGGWDTVACERVVEVALLDERCAEPPQPTRISEIAAAAADGSARRIGEAS